MSEQAVVKPCPYADELKDPWMRKLLPNTRMCVIIMRHCVIWSDPDAVEACRIKERMGAKGETKRE